MCLFDLADIPGEALPVSGPLSAFWGISSSEHFLGELNQDDVLPCDPVGVPLPEDDDDELRWLYAAVCQDAPEDEFSVLFPDVDWLVAEGSNPTDR